MVYLSLKPANPLSLLAEVAEALDVEGEVVVAAAGELPEAFKLPRGGRVKVVPFKSAGELAERLKRVLA